MATKVQNLKLTDKVYTEGSSLSGVLTFQNGDGQITKTYDGSQSISVSAGDLGLATAYIPKGSITVAAANAGVTGIKVGWVYNLSDKGTIQNGIGGTSFDVKAGDNIVWVEESRSGTTVGCWDKLSTAIVYTGSGAISVDSETHVISVQTATDSTVGVVKADTNTTVAADGAISVSLDKAASLWGKPIASTATLGDIIGFLGGTVDDESESE